MRNTFLLLSLVLVAAPGCGGTECGAGTRAEGDSCVPVCVDGEVWSAAAGDCAPACGGGTEWSDADGACIPQCQPGTHRDTATGACLADSADCVSGQVFDPTAGECVDVAGYCAEGTTWSAEAAACVSFDSLLTADQTEGALENDPSYGDGTGFESLLLPPEGESWVIGGTIETPTDKNADGYLDPDYDWWVFSVGGPTLLRVAADGVGGASSGYVVLSADEFQPVLQRFAIGSTSDGVVRDIYLPRAGTYALVASDAMNLITSPPVFGGPGFGYFITITHMTIPAPTPITFTGTAATASGAWPIEPPESGSMLSFYSVSVAEAMMLETSLLTSDPFTVPALVVDDGTTVAEWQSFPWPTAYPAGTEVLFVPDSVYCFNVSDTAYTLELEDASGGTLTDSLADAIDQPAWDYFVDASYPFTYYLFEATQGEVASIHATSSIPNTFFQVVDSTFMTSFGTYQGADGYIRFHAPATGLYVVAVLGLDGYDGWSMPAQSLDITLGLRRQVPEDLGALTTPWSATGVAVTADDWEKFYLFDPGSGDAWQLAATSVDLAPVVNVYDISVPGPLVSSAGGNPLLTSFPEGLPLLIGVGQGPGVAGSFDFAMEPLLVDGLGAVTAASPIDVNGETMTTTESRHLYGITVGAPGRATITVTPASDLDVQLIHRNASFAIVGAYNAAPAGGAETFTVDVGPGTLFVEVATASGAPPAADTTYDIDVTLVEFLSESEDNGSPATADPVTPPATIVGQIAASGDDDYFAVTVDAPGTLAASTRMLASFPSSMDTVMWVYDSTSAELDYDDDGGEGLYSAVSAALPAAGTYYVRVSGYGGSATGWYALDVSFL